MGLQLGDSKICLIVRTLIMKVFASSLNKKRAVPRRRSRTGQHLTFRLTMWFPVSPLLPFSLEIKLENRVDCLDCSVMVVIPLVLM